MSPAYNSHTPARLGKEVSTAKPSTTAGDSVDTRDVRSSSSYLDASSSHPPSGRRSSLASVFSDISDLPFMANDHVDHPLMRTTSNASAYSSYSTAGPSSLRQRLQVLYLQNYGALLVLLSQFFGSGMNVATRLLEHPGTHGTGMHPFQILFVRQSLTCLLCTTYALTTKSIPYFPLGPPDRKVRLLLVCRGLFGFFGVFGMYFSLLYLPLSEATVLTFLAPILTCYACSLLLPGENFTRQQQMAGFVSLIGVIFIAHPVSLFSSSTPSAAVPEISSAIEGGAGLSPTNSTSDPLSGQDLNQPTSSQHLLAIGLAMIGVVGSTGAMTAIRSIGTRAHAFVSINYFSVWSSIVSVIALIVFPEVSFRLPSNVVEWALLLSLGICGFFMQGLLTMGLSYGGPSAIGKPTPPETQLVSADSRVTNSITDIEMQARPQHRPPLTKRHSSTFSAPLSSPNIQTSQAAQNKTPSTSQLTTTTSRSRPKPKTTPSGNRATSMVYCQMLFALAADKLIFGTTPGLWSWVGSGLILAGAVWVAAARDGPTSKSSSPATKPNKHVDSPTDPIVDDEVRVGLLAADGDVHGDGDKT